MLLVQTIGFMGAGSFPIGSGLTESLRPQEILHTEQAEKEFLAERAKVEELEKKLLTAAAPLPDKKA